MYSFLSTLRSRFSGTHENLNGRHHKTYDNGDHYDGEFLNGQRHGQGVCQRCSRRLTQPLLLLFCC